MLKCIAFVFGFFSMGSQAQLQLSTVDYKSEKLDMDYFVGVDPFEGRYFVKNQTLFLNKAGGIQNYANLQLGPIHQIEIFNALKIAVLHRNFNTVVLLDNRLAEVSIIDFNTISPFRAISHISYAHDNNFWLFNTLTLELELFNYDSKKTLQKTLPMGENLIALQSNYNNVLALTPTTLYHYNYTGSLISKMEHNGLEDFILWGDQIIALKNNMLYTKSISNDTFQILNIPKKTIKQFFVMNQTLYIYDGENLHQNQLIKD